MNAIDGERLQKVLAQLGLASRREAEAWIRAGRLTINGRIAQLGDRATAHDQLRVDGRLVRQRVSRHSPVLLCHRSPGIALLPRAGQADAVSLQLPRAAGRRFISVSPLPQIDGGLELLTADGALAARLQRAVRRLPMEFSLRVRGELSDVQLAGLQAGVLDRGVALPVESIEAAGGEGANHWYTLRALGVSGNDLRQLLERQGVTVSRVLRTRLGPLQLQRSLPRGRSRELSAEELAQLLSPAAPPDKTPAHPATDR
jgi:23S rRNA pseudouridine2605 synthase